MINSISQTSADSTNVFIDPGHSLVHSKICLQQAVAELHQFLSNIIDAQEAGRAPYTTK